MQFLASVLPLLLAALPPAAPPGLTGPAPVTHGSEKPVLAAREVELSRVNRSPADLVSRTQALLTLFSQELPDTGQMLQWAELSLSQPQRTLPFHPLPQALPGLVVMYHPREDDLMVFDVERFSARPELEHGPAPVTPDEGVGETAAHNVMAESLASLAAVGVLPGGYEAGQARLGIWRELEGRGPGMRAEWIVEYQYTLNRSVAGLELIDAGVRIGIDREGMLSSVRVTDVEVSTTEEGPMPLTVSQARDAFLAAEQSRYPDATIHVERERVGALLGPDEDGAMSAPCLVINYSLGFGDGPGPAAISRQKITTVSLVSGSIEQVYPVPADASE